MGNLEKSEVFGLTAFINASQIQGVEAYLPKNLKGVVEWVC